MRIAIYVRVSTNEQAQEGYSIAAQVSLLKDYSRVTQNTVIKVYQDAGISGKNIKDRPALCELLKDAGTNTFDLVLVWKLSRLSRSLMDLLSIVDTLNKYKVSFQSYSEKFDTSTPMGKMLLQMLGSIAEFERNTIIDNVKMGMNERFKQGHSKGSIPYGYKYENKKAIIVPEQAEIVQHVFTTYINSSGNCLTALAEDLNARGVRTKPGGLWQRTTIRDMIQNHFYAGYVRTGVHPHGYKKLENAQILKGCHEPIVSEEVFQKASQMIKAGKLRKVVRFPDNDSVLTGLVVCPLCGANMFALNTVNKHKTKNGEVSKYPVRMYRCNNKDKGKGVCKGIYISAHKVEPFVIAAITEYIDSKKYIQIANDNPLKDSKINDIDTVTNEIEKTKTTINKYLSLFESSTEVNTAPFLNRINELYHQLEILENKKQTMFMIIQNSISDTVSEIEDFNELYSALNNGQRKGLLREVIQSVNLTNDKRVKSVIMFNGDAINLLS